MKLRGIIIVAFMVIASCAVKAQDGPSVVTGKIVDADGRSLPGITVLLDGTGIGDATDRGGNFSISLPGTGQFNLTVSGLGYARASKEIVIKRGEVLVLEISLEESTTAMEEIVITGKTPAEEKQLQGYHVEIVEIDKQRNLPADLNQILSGTTGVNLREAGGLGSGFDLSLNGLSGNQVRYFIDGVPMEDFGPALTLNNFQTNLIERLEVYKGVVPVALGADALGGAINIITNYRRQSFMDISYTTGSFNTHRASVNGQYADDKKKYYAKTTAFFNHSDNNYRMRDVPVYDLELGNFEGETTVRRFHDHYTSAMVYVEGGIFDRKLADHLSIGIRYAGNRKNYQHPDNNIKRVFGQFRTRNTTLLSSITYDKQWKKFKVEANALAGYSHQHVVDTSTLKYNWADESVRRNPTDPKGELYERRSHLLLNDKILKGRAGIEYTPDDHSTIAFNMMQSHIQRTGEDKVNAFNNAFQSPNTIDKQVAGLAYTYRTADRDLEATAFGKSYRFGGRIVTEDVNGTEVVTEPSLLSAGYGGAVSYTPMPSITLKTSFEKAYRIPESFEILGDGIYVNPNPALQPEQSHNFNAGMRYQHRFARYHIKAETNYFYRYSQDFIRFNPLGPFGEFENLDNVKSEGIEASVQIKYRELLSLSTNMTYQSITDRTAFDEGLPNSNYKSRVPNIPYLFGNLRVGVSPLRSNASGKLNLYWNTRYVHAFFLIWENLGDPEQKHIIPGQIIHDLQAEYSMNDGRYNISLTVSNIADALAYDNFSIQKPGRAAYLKLRYFLH